MDEQFVDFYQILELPLDADSNTLRKRINALYLEAQGNLDHRNFATRLKYQELFEATLPQARFVLLDDARRAEYTALVQGFRAPPGIPSGVAAGEKSAFPLPPLPRTAPRPSPPSESPNYFSRSREEPAEELFYDGRGAQIEPLPTARPAAEQLEAQRQELWKKWKVGLEDALAQEKGAQNSTNNTSTRAEPPPAPRSAGFEPAPLSRAAQETRARQQEAQQQRAEARAEAEAKTLSATDIEARRTLHRRDVTREMLVNVGLIWSSIGALVVVVPGAIALIAFMGHSYPRGARALLGYNPNLLWLAGFLVIAAMAWGVAQALSKTMRRRKATELAALSYEEVLRQAGSGTR